MNDTEPDSSVEDEAFMDAVRRTAYFLWEQAGRPHGRHEEFFLQALEQHRRERTYDAWLQDEPETRPEDGRRAR
jgi:hypothetical protein